MKPIGLEVSGLLEPHPTGIGLYGRGVVEALARRGVLEYVLLYPLSRRRKRRFLDSLPVPARWYGNGSRLERRLALVHALDTRLPASYRGPLVATLFDLLSVLPLSASLRLAPPAFRAKKRRAYGAIARRARCIVTLSEAVRASVAEHFPESRRVVAIPPGVDLPHAAAGAGADDDTLLARYGIRAPFLLQVGALCPRKNVEGAARAFDVARRRRPDLRLVLAGEPAYGWKGSAGERALARLGDAAVRVGYLPRPALWAAYRSAEALLYLSHYEGFGLPVVEGLAAGTPVVASRRGGIPEAAGGAARLADPDQAEEVDAALAAALDRGRGAAGRRERGLAHARTFTWDRTAAALEALYGEFEP